MMIEQETFDVVVIGAGAAGLSAALFLARARRRTLVYDGGPTRNSVSPFVHEYIGHEGLTPEEVQTRGRKEVMSYGAEIRKAMVQKIDPREDGWFDVWSGEGKVISRTVVLATGLVDILPEIPGLPESWGIDVHVCPCFNGYEVQNKRLVAFGLHERLAQSGKFLTAWSKYVTVITPNDFEQNVHKRLIAAGVTIVKDEVANLTKKDERLISVVTKRGNEIPCDGIYISAAMQAASPLAKSLCEVDEAGFAKTDVNGKTSRPGIWAIGNATDPISHLVHAAAAGTNAGPWINDYLIDQTLAKLIK